MSASSDLLNGAATVGAGAYLVTVVYKGNTHELFTLLKSEKGYIDFVIALFILGAIQKYGPTSKLSSTLTAITLIALAVKTMGKTGVSDAITKFGRGEAGILETAKSILGVN